MYAWFVRITYKGGVYVDRCFPDTDDGARKAHHEWLYFSQAWRPGDNIDKRWVAFVDQPERRFVPEPQIGPFALNGALYRNVRFVEGKK